MGGLIALSRIPVQLTPEIQRPAIRVKTSWYGASPEEVEKEIIEEQEKYLKSIEGVLEMTSEASDGQGTIVLKFPVGVDIVGATVKVTNRLNEVPSYPDDADRPVVTTSGPFENAVAWFSVRPTGDVYVPHMKTFIEDVVLPRLERVEGVAGINIFGGLEQELHVTFDPELLASTGITIRQLSNVLRAENRDISAGDFSEGKRRYVVRTISRFEDIDDVKQTVITMRDGIPIRVGDVAEVELDYRKPAAQVRHLGVPALAFAAQRQVGANVLEVIDGLLEQMEIINEEILADRGMKIVNVYRQSVYIESAIDLVFNNLYLGGFLAIMVLFLFLRSVRSILVIGMAIPISIITTFAIMYLLGRTINVISLAGMAFAVGLVVDSSIIVLENIYRHLQMGKEKFQAALEGTKEVWGALLASTVTTIAVFLPLFFIQERAGQLFRDIAIAISAAIAISLIVSVTVIPSLSSRILKVTSSLHRRENKPSRLERMASQIAGLVDLINARPMRRVLTIVGIIAVTSGLSWALLPDSEYLPNGNQNFIFAFMLPPPGYNLDEMLKAGDIIESNFRPLWEADAAEAEALPGGGVDNFFYVAFRGMAFFGLSARDATRTRELLPLTNGALFSIPGTYGMATQASLFDQGFAGSRSLKIDISGPDLTRVLGIAKGVFRQVGKILPGSNSRPIPGLDLGNPEVRVYPDRVRAAEAGYSASDIGLAVNALVDGARVSQFWYAGHEIDLVLEGRDDWVRHTQDLAQLPLAATSGQIITLGDIARIEQQQGPVQINHVERQRTVSVETTLPDDIPLEEAIRRVEEQIIKPLREQGQIGGLYDINISGTADDLSRLQSALTFNFLIAILITYLLLAALFQSFTYPLVIMLTVPLATFGGVMGLNIIKLFDSGQQMDILTMLGFVILLGTVINNSILIVHHALQLMREGMDARAAVNESVRVRVRPIFMSTGTSALGMLPLIVMPGAGSELYRGLGSVVVGGLVFSSVITLLVTPLVFSYAIELKQKVQALFGLEVAAVARETVIESQQ